jgi:hypothetical protein
MSTAMSESLEHELEMAANVLSRDAEAESPQKNRVYFDSWAWTGSNWQYLGRDGPWDMTKQEATGMILTLQLKYRAQAQSLGASMPTVQCFAYFPISGRWVPCQNWY